MFSSDTLSHRHRVSFYLTIVLSAHELRIAPRKRYLELRLHTVIPSPVPHVISRRVSDASDFDFYAPKFGERCALRGVIGQEILRTQFVTDFAEGFVELCNRCGVIIFPPGVLGDLNQGVLTAGFTSGAAFDGHDD